MATNLNPLNATIIDPDENIQSKGWLPVTSHSMFESSSQRFHPDGLYSEVIFGQIGSPERLIKRGYIDLHTTIISPHLFRQFISLKSIYKDILAGKEYAIFDKETKDLIKVDRNDPDGRTGYSFVVECYPKMVFPSTSSQKREDKISLLKKFDDRFFLTRFLVIPAALRDVKLDHGRVSPEEINKIYLSLLSLSQSMPGNLTEDPVFDAIRYQIQMKVQQIYEYIFNLISGKGGVAQSKYAARGIMYGTRNVITSDVVSKTISPAAPNMFSVDEIECPLFQVMKAAEPLIINKLKSIFFEQVFSNQTTSIPLINPDTLKLEYHEVEEKEIKRYTSSEGLAKLIEEFRDIHIQKFPFTVEVADAQKKDKNKYYLYMIYDDGDIIYPFRNVEDFKHWFPHESSWTTQGVTALEAIDLDPAKCIVIGSAALQIFGHLHQAKDVDLVVTDDVLEKIKSSGEYTQKDNKVWTRNDGRIDIYNELLAKEGITYQTLIKDTQRVDGFQVVSPKWVYFNYKNSNRLKDRKKLDFLRTRVLDETKIRPMTFIELCYIAAFSGLSRSFCTATRYPVLNLENIRTERIHVVSTSPSRVVKMRSMANETNEIMLPNYPCLNESIKTSMSPHPSHLEKLGADYDGDTMSLNVLMTDTAIKENEEFMNSPLSMVDANGKLIDALGNIRVVKYSFFAVSYHSLD